MRAPGSAAYGHYFCLRRQSGNAADQLHKTPGMQPDYPPAHELPGMVYEQEGRTNEAIAELQRVIDLSDGCMTSARSATSTPAWGGLATHKKMLLYIAENARGGYISPYQLAIVHAGLGEKQKAFADLERAYADVLFRPHSSVSIPA